MSKSARTRTARAARKTAITRNSTRASQRVSSEEAIRAGEQIALAAFASGLKLAAAFGTVAAKTAGLALASLASGADKFSELVKEEALRSGYEKFDGEVPAARKVKTSRAGRRKSRSS